MIKTIPTGEPGRILRSDRRRWTYDDLREMPETMDRYEIIVLREARFEPFGRFAPGQQARSALLEGFSAEVDTIFN